MYDPDLGEVMARAAEMDAAKREVEDAVKAYIDRCFLTIGTLPKYMTLREQARKLVMDGMDCDEVLRLKSMAYNLRHMAGNEKPVNEDAVLRNAASVMDRAVRRIEELEHMILEMTK
jgi:hypothetical protein